MCLIQIGTGQISNFARLLHNLRQFQSIFKLLQYSIIVGRAFAGNGQLQDAVGKAHDATHQFALVSFQIGCLRVFRQVSGQRGGKIG